MRKPIRTGFVSYAHDDGQLVARFLGVMGPRWLTQRDVELGTWTDRAIFAGERWEVRIRAALAEADFGLLCVSHSLLSSSFITTVELPELLRAERLAIPVALEPLDLERVDLKGLEDLQVFHLRGRSFDECRGVNAKRFCDGLVGEIVQRLRNAERLP